MANTSAREIQQSFGARLREVRRRKGLSQEQLALRSELDRSFVGQVERGERNISLTNIYKLARGLGVTPNSLFEPSKRDGARSDP